jgi:hypothetical protein
MTNNNACPHPVSPGDYCRLCDAVVVRDANGESAGRMCPICGTTWTGDAAVCPEEDKHPGAITQQARVNSGETFIDRAGRELRTSDHQPYEAS